MNANLKLIMKLSGNMAGVSTAMIELQNDISEIFMMHKVLTDQIDTLKKELSETQQRLAPIEKRGSFRLVSNTKK